MINDVINILNVLKLETFVSIKNEPSYKNSEQMNFLTLQENLHMPAYSDIDFWMLYNPFGSKKKKNQKLIYKNSDLIYTRGLYRITFTAVCYGFS